VEINAAGDRAQVGLVGRLVRREADVPVDPKDLGWAQRWLQLCNQLLHLSANLDLVLAAMGVEESLGVV